MKKSSYPIPIKNAGMVLLNQYFPMLFARMNLLDGEDFSDTATRIKAAHVLQYVVTGSKETPEQYLSLNKVLCGIPLPQPVTESIQLSPEQEELISGMILAAITQWTAAGHMNVDGFRGNWLVRDGLLYDATDKWELVVEPRPYDILINRFPSSFSIIKHHWMDKPLHVKWNI